MGWVRMDDRRALNRKLRAVGFEARGLDEAAICQVASDMTDGFIAEDAVEMLAAAHRCRQWRRLVAALVREGRWSPFEGGWLINGYLEYNPTRAQWEAEQEKKRGAGKRGGLAKAEADAMARAMASGKANATTGAIADPSRPVPTRLSLVCTDSSSSLDPEDDDEGLAQQVFEAMGLRDLERRLNADKASSMDDIGDPVAWSVEAARRRRLQYGARLSELLAAGTRLSVDELVELLDPSPSRRKTPAEEKAAVAARRAVIAACSDCDEGGWAEDGYWCTHAIGECV